MTDFLCMPTSRPIPGGGTVPPNLLMTAEKPDLVIIDRMEEKMDIFKLPVPLDTNIKNASTNILSQIITMDVSVHPFEIGSRGYISPSKKANLKKLLSFTMCENLSSLAVLSSYHIFRKQKTLIDWDQETPFLKTTSDSE